MSKKKGMNLPNKLTVLRVCLVPVFLVVMMIPVSVLPSLVSGLIGVGIFIIASITDMLDGKIARRYGLVTNFGKLMDPLADKFMVIGALSVIVYRAELPPLRLFYTIVLLVVIFRELAVTSLRLVASTLSGAVVAANLLGKIKTVVQIVFIGAVFIEPALYTIPFVNGFLPTWWVANVPVTYTAGALTLLFTIWSGINYFIGMWKYLDPEK